MYWEPQYYNNYPNQYINYPNVSENDYRQSLTGLWNGNDGGLYYIHQPVAGSDSPIFWSGLSEGGLGNSFANVFVGDLRPGGMIEGRWGDVPVGQILQHGRLRLKVEAGGQRIRAIQQTGGFGGSVWTKR